MNKLRFLSVIIILFSTFTLTSCDNEPIDPAIDLNNPNNGGNQTPASFKADFNGATWNASTTQAVVSGNMIQIVGLKNDGTSFGFIIDGSTTGTYPANTNILAYNPAGSEYGYWSTNFQNPEENTGSIVITSIDTVNKKISGTFSFKGYWSNEAETGVLPINFTNGVFTNLSYVGSAETGDSFFAKVGGAEFVDTDILSITTTISGQEFISIGAQDASLNSMTVSVRSNVGTGTYAITGNVATDQAQAVYEIADQSNQAVSGSVTITEKTADRIKGTFSFVTNGTTPYAITEGKFDVGY